MRLLYLLFVYLTAPLMFAFWFWRGVTNRAYMDRLGQRFGIGVPILQSPSIWIHAVSVGEVQAALPLIRELKRRFPGKPVVVTTVTPTGADRVKAVFGDTVVHAFVPYETNGAIKRFFDGVKPELAVILETEIWPNLYNECGRRNVPLVLASARISPRSVRRYRRLVPLFREALSHGIVIAAQSEADADRFRELGAAESRTFVTGNIKFDIQLDGDVEALGEALRSDIGGGRPVWVAASTHSGEEEQVLAAHLAVRQRFSEALLILVPRHPQRFDEVARLIEERGMGYVRRTSGRPCRQDTVVYLGDTMGDVPTFYAASDVAFVGGSLVPIGGHNLLEPAALGLPIVTGPHLFNAEDIAQLFSKAEAAVEVNDEKDLGRVVCQLFADEDARIHRGQRAKLLLAKNRGALRRLMALIEPLIDEVSRKPA